MQYFAQAFSLKARALTTAEGTVPEKLPDSLREWIGQHAVKTLFREASADPDVLRRMLFEFRVDPGNVIHTLTLPPAGTSIATPYKMYEVSTSIGAIQHICEMVLNTLAVD